MQVPVKAHELQPRHVANLAWAFAVRKAYSPALYDALAGRMVQLLQMDRGGAAGTEGQPEGSGSSTDSLFSVANDVVLPHHLSLVAWSFAKQVGAAALAVRPRLGEGGCVERFMMSQMSWGAMQQDELAWVRQYLSPVCICAVSQRLFMFVDVCCVLQGHKHEPMMLAIADRAAQMAGQMLPQVRVFLTAVSSAVAGTEHCVCMSHGMVPLKGTPLPGNRHAFVAAWYNVGHTLALAA